MKGERLEVRDAAFIKPREQKLVLTADIRLKHSEGEIIFLAKSSQDWTFPPKLQFMDSLVPHRTQRL